MKADLRISVKDYARNKNLKVLLLRVPFASRRFFVRMNGQRWPRDGRPASLTKVFSALRKALVRNGVLSGRRPLTQRRVPARNDSME